MRKVLKAPTFLIIMVPFLSLSSLPTDRPPQNNNAIKLANTSWVTEGATGNIKFHKGHKCKYIEYALLASKKQNYTYGVMANQVIILRGDRTAQARRRTILQYYETARLKFFDRWDYDLSVLIIPQT